MADDDFNLSLRYGSRNFDEAAAGIDAFIRDLRQGWSGSARQAGAALREYLMHVAQILAERHGTPWPAGTTDSSLSLRTGQSVQSILRSVKVTGTTWERLSGSIGGRSTLYIHEYGGTIRAKGKLLTIPLPAALSLRGTSPPFARQWKNTFVAETKKGNLLIFQRRPTGIVPLYVLVEQVRVRPRLGMRAELERQIPYFLSRAADMVVRDVVQQLGG